MGLEKMGTGPQTGAHLDPMLGRLTGVALDHLRALPVG